LLCFFKEQKPTDQMGHPEPFSSWGSTGVF
jgi:hypothetical protein